MDHIADRRHACGSDVIKGLQLVTLEKPSQRRRGRPRTRTLPIKAYVGTCAGCQAPRYLSYRPRRQGNLFDAGAAAQLEELQEP